MIWMMTYQVTYLNLQTTQKCSEMQKTAADKETVQDGLTKLVKWSEKWQMLFNFGKCKCIHIGHGNVSREYFMGNTILGTSVKEKDLGVTISADMTVSEQCGLAAAKGNQILGLIRRNITYMEKTLIIPLYKAIARPHLEYYITFRHGGHVIRKTSIN